MSEQKPERSVPGEQADGSFDLSELPEEPAAAERLARLEVERDEAIEARKRAMADFVNYQRRAGENEVRARRDGVSSVVRSLLSVLDHVQLALDQDPTGLSVDQLMEGLRILRDELHAVLDRHAVRAIAPETASEFDPREHQSVMCEPTDRQKPNTIVSVLQVGYALDDTVLRPASVTVAAPPEDAEDAEDAEEH